MAKGKNNDRNYDPIAPGNDNTNPLEEIIQLPIDNEEIKEPTTTEKEATNPLREIIQPFIDFAKVPKVLWGVNISYLIEGMVYFGILTFMAIYFNDFFGLNDHQADLVVGFFTGGITLAMLFLGGMSDKIGIRKALLFSLIFMLIGRIIFTGVPYEMLFGKGSWVVLYYAALFGLFLVIIGYGMYQPAAYAAVKEFTDEKTATMGYAVLYAVMNLGGFLPGLISPRIRAWYRDFFIAKLKAAGIAVNPDVHYGMLGVFWFYVISTFLGIVVLLIYVNKKTIAKALEEKKQKELAQGKSEEQIEKERQENKPKKRSLKQYFLEHPLRDVKFAFFIFALIPVQTLFAHNWLTLPQYVDRAFGPTVKANMELFVNFNPILIFILTPLVAAITAKSDTMKMMILGTFVMALPTFFLAIGPNVYTLFAYIIVMSIGEAMWQPRFLQYAAELAPPGRTGEYMGIAQFPWFLTKIITALYAGWFLMHYCPVEGPKHTEQMWFYYGLIAITSPILLFLTRGWLRKEKEERDESILSTIIAIFIGIIVVAILIYMVKMLITILVTIPMSRI
ncbi:conserved hypothetical protein [Thermotomaculum hydrothermale]|uniref:Major facilitator superfamily (MFS) profile domain-containing protein n=1 Tax=Thermotomaculum hydrothermale TaxID=981385 RepID=A0A7R6PQ13_9BACT|nr:MFS transporter [Thermotomaculum hydrothermale]BBB33201.1 conserved hypothetical protein [Thermotomaculum hydrothermale]